MIPAVNIASSIPMMSDAAIAKVNKLQAIEAKKPQVKIETEHFLHAGMYSRTIKIPKGVLLTGALIKIPTILIISGDAIVFMEGKPVRFKGYGVLQASAKRKQVFLAESDVHLTMIFPTNAKTVQEAEAEFTDEAHLLMSRKTDLDNSIIVTGD